MSESDRSRWAGRNSANAAVRDRVWSRLVETEVNVGPAFDRIPNFVGADAAAKRLSDLEQWKRARVVKCNPDPPQIPVRLRALSDGKLLFSPVPYLTKGFPYLRIDPEKLKAEGIDFEIATTSQGFMQHGEPVGFEDMPKLDFCVVGCVAVTRRGGRTGKGAGFADLEQGVFRELGLADSSTPIATTAHSSQVVEDPARTARNGARTRSSPPSPSARARLGAGCTCICSRRAISAPSPTAFIRRASFSV